MALQDVDIVRIRKMIDDENEAAAERKNSQPKPSLNYSSQYKQREAEIKNRLGYDKQKIINKSKEIFNLGGCI